ncbi:MAG: integrin alpha [Planctomycetota bacterium]
MILGVLVLFLLPAPQELLYEVHGYAAGVNLGASTGGAGDLDGDGYGDFMVGLPSDRNRTGRVQVYSGRTGELLRELHGEGPEEDFGHALDCAGDLNHDGYPDLVIGAPLWSKWRGQVRVFSGRDGTLLHRFIGEGRWPGLGWSVRSAGDVNHDGTDDVIAGAPGSYDDYGYAQVYSGSDGATLHTFYGVAVGGWFGGIVLGLGDVDDDEHSDVLVGAPAEERTGTARVYSGKTGATIYLLKGWERDSYFGVTTSPVGDLDRDGLADWIISAAAADADGWNSGCAHVYSGKEGALLFKFSGDQPYDYFGGHAGGVGDVNGDSVPDLVCSAGRGRVELFSGETGAVLYTFQNWVEEEFFGEVARPAGDVNADGLCDLIVGSRYDDEMGSYAGAAWVFAGNDVFLNACPNVVAAGDAITLTVREAGAGSPALLVTTAVDGRAVYVRLLAGRLDEAGSWLISGIIPTGLDGTSVALRAITLSSGRVVQSADKVIRIL